MQRLFFGLVFFAIVTPIGALRRLFVRDPLVFSSGAEKSSAFVQHEGGTVRREHLERPF